MSSKKIVIFASGSGSSVENILLSYKNTPEIIVSKLYCNKPEAFVLHRIKKYNIETLVFNSEELNNGFVLRDLNKISPDLIVLAGFLKKIPENIIHAFENKIINIHPSLLPKYPGLDTHNSVLENGDLKHGVTIHYVNEVLDGGKIIAQGEISVGANETAQGLQKRIHAIEHVMLPMVVSKFADGTINTSKIIYEKFI